VIIGLMGRAGSGKDTAARYLVEKYGFTELKNARMLKRIVEIYMKEGEILPEELYAILLPNEDKDVELEHISELIKIIDKPELEEATRRRYLQIVVGSLCRLMDRDIFAFDTATAVRYTNKDFVVSDVRYPNEHRLLKSYGDDVVLVYLDRPSEAIAKVRPDVTPVVARHSSEGSVFPEDADYVFTGDGIENLLEFIDEVMEKESNKENGI